jgi:DNA-binding SARP family transcriptional activator/Tfp pilus assembly protein PilF
VSQYDKLSIKLLGSFELETSRGPSRLPKKAQALLSFLALERGRFFSRDLVSTLLWGNSATDQARQSLRQCLTALRNGMGPEYGDLLLADGSEVSLSNADRIDVDTETFATLAQSGKLDDLERAAAIYRDDFLVGLYVTSDPFTRWTTIERQRLLAARLELYHRIALMQAKAGRIDDAIASARALLEMDELNEQNHQLLMRLLHGAGQRGAALKQYDRCVEVLRQELDIEPAAETTLLANGIRSNAVTPDTKISIPGKGARPADVLPMGPLLPDRPSLVVIPFTNLSGSSERDYFIEGLVDDITVALGRESWLFVIAGASAQVVKDHATNLSEVASKVGVRYVLKGSVRIESGDVIFVVQLSDALRGVQVWSERFRDKIDNVFALQERLTTKVAASIAPALISFEVDRALHKPTENLTAFDRYLRALPHFRSSQSENLAALKLLYEAIELDPNYATAHAMAARCYQFQQLFDWGSPDDPEFHEGVRLAHRAIDIGKNDSEALWMAGLALVQLGGEIDHGIAQIERSLAINPNSANAWTASCFARSYLGDTAAAIDHFEKAQRLNPLDVSQHVHWNAVAWAYLGNGQIEDAHNAAVRTLSLLPAYPPGLRMKMSTCGLLGRMEEARECVAQLRAIQPSCTVAWMSKVLKAALRRNRRAHEMWLEGARRAGLPER